MKNYLRKKLRKIFAVCDDVRVISEHVDGSGSSSRNVRFPPIVRQGDDPKAEWELMEVIGDGSFGKVFKAKHRKHVLLAAAKQCELEDEDVDAFLTELKIVTTMSHPNIVGFLDGFCYEQKLWLFLEYCDLGALDTIMYTLNRPLTEGQISCVTSKVTLALNHLHKNGIIHRDIKCGNVLVTSNGDIKLADYGVSAINRSMNDGRRTIIGTPYWMAPEVFMCETEDRFVYNYKVDIWSLGITLIECAEMKPPHHQMQPNRLSIKIQRAGPPALNTTMYGKEFHSFISQCLVKEPAKRAATDQLLQHPFIAHVEDMTPIRRLADEYIKKVEEDDDGKKSRKSKVQEDGDYEQRESSPTETDSGAVMLSTSGSSEATEDSVENLEDEDEEPEQQQGDDVEHPENPENESQNGGHTNSIVPKESHIQDSAHRSEETLADLTSGYTEIHHEEHLHSVSVSTHEISPQHQETTDVLSSHSSHDRYQDSQSYSTYESSTFEASSSTFD